MIIFSFYGEFEKNPSCKIFSETGIDLNESQLKKDWTEFGNTGEDDMGFCDFMNKKYPTAKFIDVYSTDIRD